MKIDLVFDQDPKTLPQGFVQAVQNEANWFDRTFTNPVEFTLHVGYGECRGSAVTDGATNNYDFHSVSYTDLVDALTSNATSQDEHTSVGTLHKPGIPIGVNGQTTVGSDIPDPTHGGNFVIGNVQAAALGLPTSGPLEAWVGFSNTDNWAYDPSNIQAGQKDFQDVLAHEITEIMGRHMEAGNGSGHGNWYTAMDLFHYSAQGARDLSPFSGYFSFDGGKTNLGNLNTDPQDDAGDWKPRGDAFDAYLPQDEIGKQQPFSHADMQLMNVLGWHEANPLANIPPGWVDKPVPLSLLLANVHPLPPDTPVPTPPPSPEVDLAGLLNQQNPATDLSAHNIPLQNVVHSVDSNFLHHI